MQHHLDHPAEKFKKEILELEGESSSDSDDDEETKKSKAKEDLADTAAADAALLGQVANQEQALKHRREMARLMAEMFADLGGPSEEVLKGYVMDVSTLS